ncbi:MAG: hypothetical protein Fur0012_09420 [Elusimicrobiota bacterium]
MKKAIIAVFALFVAVSSYAGNVTFDNKGDIKTMIKAISEAEVPAAEQINKVSPKEWTVMVFVNAKNNLETYGLKDVNEMEKIGSSDKVNIVAELGRINGYSTEDGDWKGSRRYLVTKDEDISKITSPVVMEIAKSDMGDWNYLVNFVKWAKENYPAKKYVLVVWNHGSGWNKNLEIAELGGKGISYDDETGNHITTAQLRQALEQTGKMNILAMDACLMQMIEVAYEVKDNANYIVASEETEPGDGYTYDTWLGPLVNKPAMSEAELSKVMVDSYGDHYQSINQGSTQSSIKAASLESFTAMVNDFADALIASNDVANAKNARTKSQAFYYSSNKDVYHFVKLVTDATQFPEVKSKGQALLDFMKKEMIVHNRAVGSKYANAFGIAAYLPSYYTSSYDELLWAKASKWDEMMKWIK